jgi:glycosyltransferase involved in cell wall biosynthesis
MASGTPVIVTSKGGPKYQVQQGITGFVAADERDFLSKVKLLMTNHEQHRRFREACRTSAGGKSWDSVLDDLLEAYQASFSIPAVHRATSALATN